MVREDSVKAAGDSSAALCSSTELLHAYSPALLFLNSPCLALQLVRPPSDLSFEAERMFARKPRRNKLVVCTQPSVQPQFTPWWEGRGESPKAVGEPPYNLCLLLSRRVKKWHQKTAVAPSLTITTISQTSGWALKRCQMFFCRLIALWHVWKGQPVFKNTMYPVFSFKGGEVCKKKTKNKVLENFWEKKKLFWKIGCLCYTFARSFSFDFYPHAAISRYLLGLLMIKDTELDAIQQFQKRQSQKTLILVVVGTFETTDESTSSKSQF